MRGAAATRVMAVVLRHWTVLALVILVVVFGAIAPAFLTHQNWLATSTYATGILALALAQTFVIVSGGIDLSVGGNVAVSGMSSALVMRSLTEHGHGVTLVIVAGIAAGLGVGLLVGVLNGLAITRLGLAPFIVTLGMLGVTQGATNLLNHGQQVSEIPAKFASAGSSQIGSWIPLPVAISLGLALLAGLLLAGTRFGLRTYAVGSNKEGTRRVGVNVDGQLLRVYALAGLLAGAGGVMTLSRFGVAQTTAGTGAELLSIAAVVIGGASLYGGSGTIFGTLVGVAVISVLVTGLVLAGLEPFWQTVVTGLVIIGAVYLDQLRDRVQALTAQRA
jgi:ribose transport system permease protein